MEREVSAKSAEEFAKEHKELVASYGIGPDQPAKQAANLPTPKKQALQAAEERLVSFYSKQVVKRKSQVAMKHAEEFHSLTQDFDRRIVELLSQKETLEGDLSVEPSKFEQDWDALDVKSVQLERERAGSVENSPKANDSAMKSVEHSSPESARRSSGTVADPAPKSQLPKRSLTSAPRTPTSIPRAVPFPGNRASPDATSQPFKGRVSSDIHRAESERFSYVGTALSRTD